MQSSVIKVLLRHLERCYTAISINNHANFTNGMHFLFEKFPYLIKPLIDFSIGGEVHGQTFWTTFCVDTIAVCISSDLDGIIGSTIYLALGS